ncbi:MAG TPA: HAMP domain-containing sensor histidine kinase [Kofleriaceae bacterium]|nr:HAMP domain-containing sensor histidine kinase [Kofleriaceae bacterium]
MWALESVLALGTPAYPERLSRHIRISNGVALLGTALAIASIPFDLVTGPPWFLVSDLTALSGSVGCLLLNARGHPHISRVLMLLSLNLVFLHATVRLGEQSEQHAVFFALSIAPFFVFSLDERRFLVPFIILPVVEYFTADYVSQWGPVPQFSVAAYRVYSAVLAFSGLIGGLSVFARITNRAERTMHWQQHVLDETRARSIATARLTALGEMSSGVAHEIRNPLTAITLAAGQITERADSPEAVTATAERIQRAAHRISSIVDSLLAFSRDAGGDPLVDVRVDQLITDALALSHSRFVEHHIELQLPPVPGFVVRGRASQLQQVLLNLLGNAHDAVEGERDAWVRLDAKRTDGWIELAVTDSGPGIPPRYRDRIFEPFFSTKPPDRGTGLGLSLSRGIVESHHGTLVLDPHSPHTRFVVRLPLEREDLDQSRGS